MTHTYAKPGTYQVTVTSTDALGNATSETATVTVVEAVKPSEGPKQPAADRIAPQIGGLAVTPRTIGSAQPRRGARRPATASGKKSARIHFTLSEDARVTFTAKRKVKRRCGKRRCMKLLAVRGELSVAGAQGDNSIPFSARLSGRPLKPGY